MAPSKVTPPKKGQSSILKWFSPKPAVQVKVKEETFLGKKETNIDNLSPKQEVKVETKVNEEQLKVLLIFF